MAQRRFRRKKSERIVPGGLSEAVLQKVLEYAPIAIALVDRTGRPVLVNQALCDMLGYTADELRRMRFTEFTHPEDVQADWELFQELLKGRRSSYTLRKRYIRKDGQVVTALLSVGLVRDEQGRPQVIIGMAQDITAQVTAEAQARTYLDQLELMRTAFEHAGEAVFITDVNGTILWVNPVFTAVTGYSAEEVVGQNPRILKSGVHPREFYERFWSHILSGQIWRGILVNRRKDGTLYYDERTIAPVFDAEGRITHFVTIGEDVTERVRLQEAMRRHERYLTAQNRILSAILEAADLDERLNRILDAVLEAMGVEMGAIHLVEGNRVVLRAWRGLSDEFRAHVQVFQVAEAPYFMRETEIVRERLSETGRFADFAKRDGVQVQASVPLVLPTGEWLGTLLLASRRYEALQEEDVQVLRDISRQVALAIWHAQLRRTAEERLRRLTVLREVDRAIVQKLDLKEVLKVALEVIPAEMGADAVAVSLLDETRTRFQVFLMRFPNGQVVEELAFDVAESLLHRFVDRQESVIIYDVSQDPRLQMHREVLRGQRLFSYLGVPLVVRGETIGVLHMFTTVPRVFNDEDVTFFRTLAGQVAIALANARAVQELRHRADQMEALHHVLRVANRRLDRRSIVQAAIEELDRVSSGMALAIFSYDKTSATLVLDGYNEAARPVAAAMAMDVGAAIEASRFRWLGDLKQGRLHRVDDLAKEEEPYFQHLVRGAGLRSALLVPIVSEGELLGVLHVGRPVPRGFTEADESFLTSLADHLAVAFRNARLFAELGQAYEDLRRAQEALIQQERLRALGQMASGIAHDINNALVPIVGYAELLERHADEQVRERARRLSEAAADIARIVERLRAFYRPRAPEESLEMVDLNEAVRRAIELTRPRWYDMPQREGVTIDVDMSLAEDLPPIAAVGTEVREALINLIFNAVDAILAKGEPRGRIALRTRRQAEWAIVEVIDTGVGMDEATRRRAVEPFFTTKGEQGSGLGLAMVYGTMRRHDGGLELESAPGQGTTARLVFPIRVAQRKAETQELEVPTAPMRILLIDDDPRVRQVLGTMLQGMGHRVTAADGGAQGLALFEEALRRGEPYDLVLTDLGMPGILGAEVVRRVKAISPSTPVIVLTGWGHEAKPPEADAALGKPVTWRDLKAILARLTLRKT